MRSESLLVLVLAVLSGASACKYYCKVPNGSTYVCCDDGNPFEVLEDDETAQGQENDDDVPEGVPFEYPEGATGCVYYCSYDGVAYCCADTSVPIPKSHEAHEGRCPEEEEQVCKSQGIFLLTKSKTAKTSGALLLAEGEGKQQPSCASDGYCGLDERCCPSKCARRHICLKSQPVPEED